MPIRLPDNTPFIGKRRAEERNCVICQKPFLARIDGKTKTCSHQCGLALRDAWKTNRGRTYHVVEEDTNVLIECSRCHSSLPRTLEFFHKDRSCNFGLTKVCLSCIREDRVAKATERKENGQNSYSFDAAKARQPKRSYYARLRWLVLTHYSQGQPHCACCAEDIYEFLAIDHIEGGGTKQRSELNHFGSTFYKWLKDNNFPTGYRVLCHNCNAAYGYYGMCPHEKLRLESGDMLSIEVIN